ncbi:MAG: NrfD/PsrC family molybdoenzyme membrane anchor subunit [Acidobacteriota bacterium]|nr:NrfD/PsrC family molybdoenzyme membrane anchor subunit [Acidobacteriota bacterium]
MTASGRDRAIEESLLRPVFETGRGVWITVGLLVAVIANGAYQWLLQLQDGMVIAGMNQPVYWGLYITNYVFFIGISHAGTLISAILRLTQAEWRRPITRAAEAITVFALLMGSSNVLWHLGRPELIYVPLLSPQPLSPLIWDVVCISVYLLGSITYLYLPLIPDLAILRDRSPRLRWFYRLLALGWQGTSRQHQLLERAIGVMAVAIIPIAVSVHTVVSWVFAMSLVPMWHSAIFGPYFVVGAIFSGIAALLIAMAILRKTFHLEAFLRPIHFNNLGLLMLTMACLWFYFTFAEHLTVWYGNAPDEIAVLNARLYGPFSTAFWTMITCCFIIPLGILSFKRTRTVIGTVVASCAVVIGMWLERYIIVISSASYPRSETMWDGGVYTPSLVEISLTAAEFAAFVLLFIVFAKLFPLVSIWEIKEGDERDIDAVTDILERESPGGRAKA